MSYLSKAELTKEAESLGITVDPDWTREEIQDAIDDLADAEPGAVRPDAQDIGNHTNLGFPGQPGEAPAG